MARISFEGLEYLDAQAIQELGRVGPIEEYIKHDQSFELGGFKVLNKGERIGSMALRSEVRPDGQTVLVIVAVYIRETANRLVDGIEEIKKMAAKNGFDFIRAHVSRAKAVKAFLKCGGEAILDFKTTQEYRSDDLDFISNYISLHGEAVMMIEV